MNNMGKFVFSGKGRYPDFTEGYTLYSNRCRKTIPVSSVVYNNIIRDYCKYLSVSFERNGMVDFPNGIGTLFTAVFQRKPQYRGKTFIGYGKMDWETKHFDGSNTAFGIVYLPNRNKVQCMRCYGFVANRRLFQRLKKQYIEQTCDWKPMIFNEKMI